VCAARPRRALARKRYRAGTAVRIGLLEHSDEGLQAALHGRRPVIVSTILNPSGLTGVDGPFHLAVGKPAGNVNDPETVED
jgi:hypothetical protein